MKFKGLKTLATITAVSAGALFVGSHNADASTRVTVQSGDTLSELAETHNVSMDSIKDANKIQDINKIYVGEVFSIGDDGEVEVVAPTAEEKVTAQAPVQTQAPTTEEPAQSAAPAVQAAPVQAQAQTTSANTDAQPAQTQAAATPAATTQSSSSASVSDDGSLASIAEVESNNNYNAVNGQYIGKYQLTNTYLNGDYSPANQEKVAREYAISRYGSIANAVAFRSSHNYW